MTKGQGKGKIIDLKALLEGDADFLRATVRAAVEPEMMEALGAENGWPDLFVN